MYLLSLINSFMYSFRYRLALEKIKQDELMDQIDALKQKVANANEGLAAANRLSEQLGKILIFFSVKT